MPTDNISSVMNVWRVTGLRVLDQVEDKVNVVVEVVFMLESHDLFGGIRGTSGSYPVNPLTLSSFTPFDELTEEIVLGWMPQTLKTRIETNNSHAALNLLRHDEVEMVPPPTL